MSHMSGATPKRITLTVTVDVDPAAHGFDQPDYRLRGLVLDAIDATPGLEVAEESRAAVWS